MPIKKKQIKKSSPTLAAGRPRRQAAIKSPSFQYDNELLDSLESSSITSKSQSCDNGSSPADSAELLNPTRVLRKSRGSQQVEQSQASPVVSPGRVNRRVTRTNTPPVTSDKALSKNTAEGSNSATRKTGRSVAPVKDFSEINCPSPSKRGKLKSNSAEIEGGTKQSPQCTVITIASRPSTDVSESPKGRSKKDANAKLANGKTLNELETEFAAVGQLTCSKCQNIYKSTASYFVKHFESCDGSIKSPGRKSGSESLKSPTTLQIAQFPQPKPGICKICPVDLTQVDDIFRHYAETHSALYIESEDDFRRDTHAFDDVLQLTGKLVCQYCHREFHKSGFSLTIHETRCLVNPNRNGPSLDNSFVVDADVNVELTIGGHSIGELEKMHAEHGHLTCPSCTTDFKSPVRYFVKHYKKCSGADEEGGDNEMDFPPAKSAKCMFCPDKFPDVEDVYRHYAEEHCLWYSEKEPGWIRNRETLSRILKLIGKLTCQYCKREFDKSVGNFLKHEENCICKTPPTSAENSNDVPENNVEPQVQETVFDGKTIQDLEKSKEETGILKCPKCKMDYKCPVSHFVTHVQSCSGVAKKFPLAKLQAFANGEQLGEGPFSCQLCPTLEPFPDGKQIQDHFMETHLAIFSPDQPEGFRTPKARELVLKKMGKLKCPKCSAVYKLVASFLYHEKVCQAGGNEMSFHESKFFAEKADRKFDRPVKCTLCPPEEPDLLPDNIQRHYMDHHCAIYDPNVGGECVIKSKEAIDFIQLRLGYLRCPQCDNMYKSPSWYFRRHVKQCGVDMSTMQDEDISDSSSTPDKTKKRRRRSAAATAKKRIGRMADGEHLDDDESRDTSFIAGSSGDDDEGVSSGVEESDENSEGSVGRQKFPRISINTKRLRDIGLRKCGEMLNKYLQESDSSENEIPIVLKSIESEFTSWQAMKNPGNYLPVEKMPVPPHFQFESDEQEKRYALLPMEATTSLKKDEAVCFVGGRTFSVDLSPIENENEAWLAVSASISQDPETRMSTFETSAVQIWRIGMSNNNNNNNEMKVPKYCYSLAVEHGPAMAVKFCQQTPEKSLLAIAGSGQDRSLISIVALPPASTISGVAPTVYRCLTGAHLVTMDDITNNQETSDSLRVTCIDWSHDGVILAAALHDATVCLWRFDSLSPLLYSPESRSLLPTRLLRAHSHPLVSVRVAPFTKNTVVTLSIDGVISIFNANTGSLLNAIMSPYSTLLTLMPGSSIPVLVNNPWYVFRRVPSAKSPSSSNKNAPIVSSLSAIDLFGDSPMSDTWPFQPVLTGGSVCSIASIAPLSRDNYVRALGFVTGDQVGKITLYSTLSHVLKIRAKPPKFVDANEKVVAITRVNDNGDIIFGVSDVLNERNIDPMAVTINPPTVNALTTVVASQILEDSSAKSELRSAKPRIALVSTFSCGLIRIFTSQCCSIDEASGVKKLAHKPRRSLPTTTTTATQLD